MTDTRCANPEYQLEVDTMMVEYSVYHAIEARLNLLKSQISGDPIEWKGMDVEGAAQRLTESSDILIRAFRQHHPDAQFTSGATFNIKILEFLVLLDDLLCEREWPAPLKLERQVNTAHRRIWLRTWAVNQGDAAQDMMIDAGRIDDASVDIIPQTSSIEMVDLLDRFMGLSAEISDALGSINEHWCRLAGEFTAQCAMERMGRIVTDKIMHDKEGAKNLKGFATWVSECFAYGIVEPSPIDTMKDNGFQPDQDITPEVKQRIDKMLRQQEFIREMFRVKPSEAIATEEQQNDDGNGQARNAKDEDGDINITDVPQTATEDPTWTTIRTNHHTTVLKLLQPCNNSTLPNNETCLCEREYAKLRQSYDLRSFFEQLRNYIEGVYGVNVDNITEKPVLVQIEEGQLVGLDEAEFEAFLDRVGLKMARGNGNDGHGNESGKGVVKWAR